METAKSHNAKLTGEIEQVDAYARYAQKVESLIAKECPRCFGRGVVAKNVEGKWIVCSCVEKRLRKLGYKSVKEYCEQGLIV